MVGEDSKRRIFLILLGLCAVYILYSTYVAKQPLVLKFQSLPVQIEDFRTFSSSDYATDICWRDRYKRDWRKIVSPCLYSPTSLRVESIDGPETDSKRSFIETIRIGKAGSFSYLLIRSVGINGKLKRIGGDSWRVKTTGQSNVSALVVDNNDGTYWIQVLFPEAGSYKLRISLDYTLCRGLEDPPLDWFIRGNAQGKYQRNEIPPPVNKFLMASMGNDLEFTISNKLKETQQQSSNDRAGIDCGLTCNFLWNGMGSWKGNIWMPLDTPLDAASTANAKDHARKMNKATTRTKRILLTYGDSVSIYFARSILRHRLCKSIFNSCEEVYSWVYPVTNVTVAKTSRDAKDFNVSYIMEHLSTRVIYNETFNQPGNVLLLNFGLHFAESVRFEHFQGLIEATVDLLQGRQSQDDGYGAKFKGTVVWKSSTSIQKERASNPQLAWRRFFTNPRVKLYNAFAMDVMCKANFLIADVFPMSDSYPLGTGTHTSNRPVVNDIVHYSNEAFYPLEDALASYFDFRA